MLNKYFLYAFLLLFILVSLLGITVDRLIDSLEIYETRVIPGLINNVNYLREQKGLSKVDFYHYVSDTTIYTEE